MPVKHPASSGDTFYLSGDFRGATVNIKSILQADLHWQINREYMLRRVRKDWLEGILEPAQASHALLPLSLHSQAELVTNPWKAAHPRTQTRPSAPYTSSQILNVFDSANGNLLILGEPGSGKTITLLQLADELVRRAEADPKHPIPVILNLSSWEEAMPLEAWLIQELRGKYFMPLPVAQSWISKDIMTLLLDGLDEVPEDKRATCIAAINAYRQDHGPAQVAVCSRRIDYENQPQRLHLDAALIIQPLSQQQIHHFLARHSQGSVVATTLDQDKTLRQLAKTPLMLTIMLQASQEVSNQDWSHLLSTAAHRERLFDVYLKSVFSRRKAAEEDMEETIRRVLPWLARQMAAQGQSVFLLEDLGPEWLKTKYERWAFLIGYRILTALLLGIVVNLLYVFGLSPPQYAPRMFLAISAAALITSIFSLRLNNAATLFLNMALTALTTAWALNNWIGGLIGGLVLGIPGGALAIVIRDPHMTEKMHWSWKRTGVVMAAIILTEILIGVLIYRTMGLATLSTVTYWLLIAALPIGTGITLSFGRRPSLQMAPTVKPNQGTWQSMRNAVGIIIFLLLVLLPLSLPAGISRNLAQGRPPWQADGLLTSLNFLMATTGLVALPLSLFSGGAACLQHLMVRSILVSVEKLPWNLIRILDQATNCVLMQRVGGGYLFQHRLLQDYFADLQRKPNPIKRKRRNYEDSGSPEEPDPGSPREPATGGPGKQAYPGAE